MNDFYVYALIDPRDEVIFYIGKGKDMRYLDHIKEISEIKTILKEKLGSMKTKLKE